MRLQLGEHECDGSSESMNAMAARRARMRLQLGEHECVYISESKNATAAHLWSEALCRVRATDGVSRVGGQCRTTERRMGVLWAQGPQLSCRRTLWEHGGGDETNGQRVCGSGEPCMQRDCLVCSATAAQESHVCSASAAQESQVCSASAAQESHVCSATAKYAARLRLRRARYAARLRLRRVMYAARLRLRRVMYAARLRLRVSNEYAARLRLRRATNMQRDCGSRKSHECKRPRAASLLRVRRE